MSKKPPTSRNLLAFHPFATIARSRLYPGILQLATASVFVLIVFQLLVGPELAHENFGTALVWVLWWPLLPILFLVLGRFWCSVCPFGSLSDLVQRVVGLERRVPGFLKKYGIWIIDASFILITWADHVWGIVGSPWGSGVLLLMITTAVIVSGAFYKRRAFCRYLCFLGGVAGNYARAGMVSLRTEPDVCATCTAGAVCFNGTEKAPACPMFEFPGKMDSSANCSLCTNCITNCPNDAITLTVRPPTSELWFISKPKVAESFLAAAIMGIVLIQNITMLTAWDGVLTWIERTTGITSYTVIFTIAFAVAVTIPVALLYLSSFVAGGFNGETPLLNFARFGYALIPLDLAGHVAHNLFHLLAEGKAVFFTSAALFGMDHGGESPAIASNATIQILQFALVGLGVFGSIYAAYRIARHAHGDGDRARASLAPYATLIVAFGILNIALFMQPMAMRM